MNILHAHRSIFLSEFNNARKICTVAAPGRVNLIGEHTDYNGGQVLPYAISHGICIQVARRTGAPGLRASTDFSDEVFCAEWEEIENWAQNVQLPPEVRASWARYVAGAAALLGAKLEGAIYLAISSNLPAGSGMSSSAALCCGVMAALSACSGFPLLAQELAVKAMLVEHRFSGTKCGLMDQLAVMCSCADSFTHIDFLNFDGVQGAQVCQVAAHKNFAQYTPVAFHTGVSHSLADSEYNQRRKLCEKAVGKLEQLLQRKIGVLGALAEDFAEIFALPFVSQSQPALKRWLEEKLGDERMAACAAHAILENARVQQALQALREGNLEQLDCMMRASHDSLADDYRVSCGELDLACRCSRELGQQLGKHLAVPPVLGPRMTGGGFGGSTVQLVHNSILLLFVAYFQTHDNSYSQASGKTPKLVVSSPQNGLRISLA